jgi:Zn-dependent protease
MSETMKGRSFATLVEFLLVMYSSKRSAQTKDHLIIDDKAIPWSSIDHIAVKKSAFGNRYLAVYFRDDTPPEGFDVRSIDKREAFLRHLRDNAAEKGFAFTVDEGVQIKEEGEEPRKGVIQTLKEHVEESQNQPEITFTSRQKKGAALFLAGATFCGVSYFLGAYTAVSLFIVILVHEGGHYAALKWFNIKVAGAFVIPFLAGVVPGEELPTPGVEAAVSLAGPAAAIGLNVVGFLLWGVNSVIFVPAGITSVNEFLEPLVLINVSLNLLNLMPLVPLDGGRILRAALVRGRKSYIPVALVTAVVGIGLGVLFQSWILMIITFIGLGSLIQKMRDMKEEDGAPPTVGKSFAMLLAWGMVMFLLLVTAAFAF